MDNLQKGDIIVSGDIKQEVLARLENLVWTRNLNEDGSVSAVSGATDIEDLITYGFKKEK